MTSKRFVVPQQLKTNRLILRRHKMKDVDAFAAFLQHPTATQYMAFTEEQKTPEGAKQLMEYVIAMYDSDSPVFSLTVTDEETDIYMGAVGLSPVEDQDACEVFYTILPPHWGNGYATEAMQAVVNYAFDTLKVKQLIADVVAENAASVRVAEKLMFTFEGEVQRDAQTGDLAHESMTGKRYTLSRAEG